MAIPIGHAGDGMGRHPARHAYHQAAHIIALQLGSGGIRRRILFIVDDQPRVQRRIAHILQNAQRLVALHLQTLDRRVDLAKAYKAYLFFHSSS